MGLANALRRLWHKLPTPPSRAEQAERAGAAYQAAIERMRARGQVPDRLEIGPGDYGALGFGVLMPGRIMKLKWTFTDGRSAVVGRRAHGRLECVPWEREYVWPEEVA